MLFMLLVRRALTVTIVASMALVLVPEVNASHIDLSARRAEREAAREAKRLERELKKTTPQCRQSVRLSLAKPTIQRQGNALVVIPRADVTIRTRGDSNAPAWEAFVDVAGKTNFSDFSGKVKVAGGPCGMNFSGKGIALGSFVITDGLGSLGFGSTLHGWVELKATLAGPGLADEDTEHRRADFRIEGLNSPKVGSWRTVR